MTDNSKMKVPELKDALAALGEPTTGKKADLVARLDAAQAATAGGKRPVVSVDLTADDSPPAKKGKKAKGKAKATAADTPPRAKWWWAADESATARKWAEYDADQAKAIEDGYAAGVAQVALGTSYVVSLAPNPSSGLYLQRRADNPHLTRPVARTADGAPPTVAPPAPPPKQAGGGSKSAVASAPAGQPSASAPAVASKSYRPQDGGVAQVRYNAPKSGGSGAMKTAIVKGRAAVAPSCPEAESFHVYESGDDVHDVLLNQTDVGANKNKYYIIQLLETDATPHQYYTWNRWGRVGEERNAQNARRGPFLLQAAMSDFSKKFTDKTKNRWADRDNFSAVPGKYTLIERDYGEAPAPAPAADAPPAKKVESKLDGRVQAFISLIADIKMMEASMREIGFDPNKMPLGKLKKTTIMKGYSVLQELSNLIVGTGGATMSGKVVGASSSSSSGGGIVAGSGQRVTDLTNQFYSVIPHTSEGDRGTRTQLPMIDTPQLLKSKIEMVEALGNIELASRVIDTKAAGFDLHPIDARYAQLGATLTPIDATSSTHSMLQEYLTNTHGATHSSYTLELTQAFEIEREGERARFTDKGNRQLLWHGSRLTNWCGILGSGLRIAPPEAPVTGYMFGKGVYFADMSSKSANYCFASQSVDTGVMLLCDVSLGKQYERLQSEYEADKSCKRAGADSTYGKGKTHPDPKGARPLPDEPKITVPMGKGTPSHVDRSSLLYNEFIVYDVAQIQQRYVLQVKFHYKDRFY